MNLTEFTSKLNLARAQIDLKQAVRAQVISVDEDGGYTLVNNVTVDDTVDGPLIIVHGVRMGVRRKRSSWTNLLPFSRSHVRG
jgi:hypothetical protein